MVFNNNIPQPGDLLSNSQGDLLNNNQALDTSFGINHYKFSNGTANNGKHNVVQTPVYVATPPTGLPPVTIANEPAFYGFQDTANIGVIQYSRGPSNAVPSPVTFLQSTSAAITLAASSSTNILDFTGITTVAYGVVAAKGFIGAPTNLTQSVFTYVIWTGTGFVINPIVTGVVLVVSSAGNVLTLNNGSSGGSVSSVYWTLQLYRIQV